MPFIATRDTYKRLLKSKYLLGYLLINTRKMMLPKDLLRLIQLQIC